MKRNVAAASNHPRILSPKYGQTRVASCGKMANPRSQVQEGFACHIQNSFVKQAILRCWKTVFGDFCSYTFLAIDSV